MLEKYAELQIELKRIQLELAKVEEEIAAQVKEVGQISGFGYTAKMKPGRKSTDHEAAVMNKFNEYTMYKMHSLAHALLETQEKFSTRKVTVQWAKVTAEANIDVTEFTTQAEPTFVIEAVK